MADFDENMTPSIEEPEENLTVSPGFEKIMDQIDAVSKKCFGPLFQFRPNQKEAVARTIDDWINGRENIIISAPTGSGKSITAMTIAMVLSTYYDMKGYILASDLNLIDQYARDIEKYFPNWAVIKGQQAYTCSINGLNFSSGQCKLKGCKSYGDIKQKFPECSQTCQYILDREKAMESDVLVCTYSFWLIQQNIVKKMLHGAAPFTSRDFVICDEAHKIVEIVQKHFSPAFNKDDLAKIGRIVAAGCDDPEITNKIQNIRYQIAKTEGNIEILDLLEEYVKTMKVVSDGIDTIMREISSKNDNKEILSKEDKGLARDCDFISNHISSFAEYVDIIKKIGSINIVKNWDDKNMENIVFNCIDESYLMGEKFHVHSKRKMYMSATIGDPYQFSVDMGFDGFDYIDIPSTFDFTNSPIYYVPDYKLSYSMKSYNLPKVCELIDATVSMYSGKRGIIQTGSYAFAKSLLENVSASTRKRLILYDDTKEKGEAIQYFKYCNDKILVGPSLIEGLSFDDDLCRFQIIMKVPYPSLGDKFVAAKQRLRPIWYSNTTAISILQGVGRGVRNDHDWCVTFIFDGCYTILMHTAPNMFNQDFMKRLQIIPATSIVKN